MKRTEVQPSRGDQEGMDSHPSMWLLSHLIPKGFAHLLLRQMPNLGFVSNASRGKELSLDLEIKRQSFIL